MGDFKWTYYFPFKNTIPNYIDNYLEKNSFFKRYLKFIKRRFYIFLKGQNNLEVLAILPEHQNILWINISAPSLGDSLMDLSSRIMLKDKKVDLFTDTKNHQLYLCDEYFNNVYTKSKDLHELNYDLVIIDSYSSRSIKVKSLVAPKTSFVGVFGYFNGPEVNRILFSFHKMNHLLGYPKLENEINNLAKNSISISTNDHKIVDEIVPNNFIVIVLGGEWHYKTYNNWSKVIDQIILHDKDSRIIFIGSANAKSTAKKLLNKYSQQNFLDFVERLSFKQSIEVVRRAKVLLCCDGGLMHGANAIGAKSVTLFARLTPKMLITNHTNSFNLFDSKDVNNILVEDIVDKYFEALKS